jgi:hypothetical protein
MSEPVTADTASYVERMGARVGGATVMVYGAVLLLYAKGEREQEALDG